MAEEGGWFSHTSCMSCSCKTSALFFQVIVDRLLCKSAIQLSITLRTISLSRKQQCLFSSSYRLWAAVPPEAFRLWRLHFRYLLHVTHQVIFINYFLMDFLTSYYFKVLNFILKIWLADSRETLVLNWMLPRYVLLVHTLFPYLEHSVCWISLHSLKVKSQTLSLIFTLNGPQYCENNWLVLETIILMSSITL